MPKRRMKNTAPQPSTVPHVSSAPQPSSPDNSCTRHVDVGEAIPTQSQEYEVLNSDCEDTETEIGLYDDDEELQRTKATNGDETT
ncbi:unnamed protein product [Phytophthora fragariaefolia]|uniref:Unnamed protein product n=1 Tax=Phytophthora fragariaefolia TaxID=1490495 RepID=A0A9W7D628_9STRA|nr:unnamed protein product [Phytophthora fragariaefolia]